MRFVARLHLIGLVGLLLVSTASTPVFARDASFVDPALSSNRGNGDSITVEPKSEIDVGDSGINISRRVALFFVNQTGAPIDVVSLSLNSDGNVTGSVISDDCSKENKIAPNSRCSVVISLTPISGGSWASEVLLTHKGAGRIARAKIFGKASSNGSNDRKDTGLSLSTKDVSPVSFGDIEMGYTQAVRSALMVNDSPDPITLLSIDLIAAENGLTRLEQGCSIDMELKPGESCPITLSWKPTTKGAVFTDLIVRHSGKMGFIVVPVRGMAKDTGGFSSSISGASQSSRSSGDKTPLPPTADELERATSGKIPAVSEDSISGGSPRKASRSSSRAAFHLIGTVGNRVVLLKPDGETSVAGLNDEIQYEGDKMAKVTNVTPKTVELFVDGKKIHLNLETAEDLTSSAVVSHHKSAADKNSSSRKDAKGGSGASGGGL